MDSIRIFISYSHENEIWLAEWMDPVLQTVNPRCLLRQWQRAFRKENVEFWFDREQDKGLRGGDRWRDRIIEEIDRADIAVLLVTQQFVISPFIMDEELPRILARHKKGDMEVLPLLVQPTRLRDLPTGGFLQWAPGKPTPLSAYFDRGDNAFSEACNEVLDALEAVIQRVRTRKNGEASSPGSHTKLEATPRSNEHVVGDRADSTNTTVDLPTGTPIRPVPIAPSPGAITASATARIRVNIVWINPSSGENAEDLIGAVRTGIEAKLAALGLHTAPVTAGDLVGIETDYDAELELEYSGGAWGFGCKVSVLQRDGSLVGSHGFGTPFTGVLPVPDWIADYTLSLLSSDPSPLICLLQDGNLARRSAAPGLLEHFPDRRVVEALIRTMSMTDNNTADNCAYALLTIAGRVRDVAAKDPLSRVLRNRNWVRRAGLVEKLKRCLPHRDPDYREGAAWILGEIGDEESVGLLRKLLEGDSDRAVQAAARDALEKATVAVDQTSAARQPMLTPETPQMAASSREPRAMECVVQRVEKERAPQSEPLPLPPGPFPAPPEGEGSVQALAREIPILAKKTLRASSYTCALRLEPDERGLLVTLEVFFQGDSTGTHVFRLPDSSHDFWVDEHDKAVVSMKIRSKGLFSLGRYDPKTACALADALTRLNALLGAEQANTL